MFVFRASLSIVGRRVGMVGVMFVASVPSPSCMCILPVRRFGILTFVFQVLLILERLLRFYGPRLVCAPRVGYSKATRR